jgi:MFS superfamily sulfate permease-like transporter
MITHVLGLVGLLIMFAVFAHGSTSTVSGRSAPVGVRVYTIAGPHSFGAAKTVEVLHSIGDDDHTYIFELDRVPTIDATELVALESMLHRLRRSAKRVFFAGLVPEVAEILRRAGILPDADKLAFVPNVEIAIRIAELLGRHRLAAASPE